jgi:hypothetical protein
MVGEALAGLSALKTAFDMAKGLKDIDDAVRRNAAVIDLQEKILAAQQAQAALVEQVAEFEKEVSRLKAWDADKQRYELTEARPGMMTYTLKKGMENGEPAHHLCTNCYNDGVKSIMQTETRFPGRYPVLVCHRCGSDLYLEGGRLPQHEGMKRRGPRRDP